MSDALEQIDFVGNITPQDVPPATISLHTMKTMLENTGKHLMIQAFSAELMEYLVRMAIAVVGSKEELARRPILHWSGGALTPLTYKPLDIDAFFIAAKYHLPIRIFSLPSAGATAPITIAGEVFLTNVEFLSGVVISQVARPGLPIMHNSLQFVTDMATGTILQASPEAMIASAASAQMTKGYYGLPAHVFHMGSDALTLDGQAMSERSFMSIFVALSGADILGGAGQVECAATVSLLQLIVDNDIIGMVRKGIQKIQVDDETLAWEAISEVGQGGHFLTHPHTLRNCRQAFRPKIFTRKPRGVWESEGGKDILEKARDSLNSILCGFLLAPGNEGSGSRRTWRVIFEKTLSPVPR